MIITKRQPVSVGEIIREEYLKPFKITQKQLASAMGVSRNTVNDICTGKRTLTVDSALLLARALGSTPDFWLNLQRRSDLWAALNTPERKSRIDRARSVRPAWAYSLSTP